MMRWPAHAVAHAARQLQRRAARTPDAPRCPVCHGAQGHYDAPGAAPHNRGIAQQWVSCNHCEGTGEDPDTEDDNGE